ncbi:hypothetical protein E4U42_000449 [Claviceps africana]|uniref:Mating-type switching protein swi10 n=1 Tax=Claviceps africana TaxID=83212 RepID=A0A8K0J0K6_9HYPO|nr:hypothetical protein E4U42_000449 [Claviceps africana]
MSVQSPARPVSSADPMSPASTVSSKQSRRSLIMMANNLKPTRLKLQKYFARSRHSAPEPVFSTWKAQNLGSAVTMASLQMGSLGNPQATNLPVVEVQDARYKPTLVRIVDTEQRRRHTPETDSPGDESGLVSSLPPSLPPSLPVPEYSVHAPLPPSLAAADSSPEAEVPLPALDDSAQPSASPLPAAEASAAEASSGAAVSSPRRPSPSPPQTAAPAPLSGRMSMETDPAEPRVRRGPSLIKPRPRFSVRRRVKTPAYKMGYVDMAATNRKQEAVSPVSRQGSVRSIARQYRTLIEDTLIEDILIEDTLIEETDVPRVPRVPSIHRNTRSGAAEPALEPAPEPKSESEPGPEVQQFDDDDDSPPRHSPAAESQHGAGLCETPPPRPRSQLAPSPAASDADTLVSFHDETAYLTPLLFPSLPSADQDEAEEQQGHADKDRSKDDGRRGDAAADAASFPIAFQLLTRELSAAFADHAARTTEDTSGLQVWLMIAAYERLRDQISATESPDPQLRGAKAMFDTWLDALRAVQTSMAGERADSESEYGDGDE